MKTGWRKYFSCVHPLYFTRATTAGFTQDGFSLVSGTLSNGHVDAANSFHLLFNSACFLASNPLPRSEEHTSELQSPYDLVCRLLLEKKKNRHARSTQVTCIISCCVSCRPCD